LPPSSRGDTSHLAEVEVIMFFVQFVDSVWEDRGTLGNIGEESYFLGMLRCTLPATNSSSPLKMGAPWNQKEIPNLEPSF